MPQLEIFNIFHFEVCESFLVWYFSYTVKRNKVSHLELYFFAFSQGRSVSSLQTLRCNYKHCKTHASGEVMLTQTGVKEEDLMSTFPNLSRKYRNVDL